MDLMHNQVIRITSGELTGIYRVVLDEPRSDLVVVVKLDAAPDEAKSKGGRRKKETTKAPRKKAAPPLVGELLWLSRPKLETLERDQHLQPIQIEVDALFNRPLVSPKAESIFQNRQLVMKDFLSFETLRDSIWTHHGLGGLVQDAVASNGVSRALVYKLWSQLCRYGITSKSLRPVTERCGAPGVPRPCDPGGRAKAGRKTDKQRVAARTGITLAPEQPGMSTDWRNRIIAADLSIPEPKPDMRSRCARIRSTHFTSLFKFESGKLVESANPQRSSKQTTVDSVSPGEELRKGDYPNDAQIRRVLETEIPRLTRLAQRTTKGHFTRSMRGLVAKSWKGVAGPGHTWAIDSTIGDIYLRSSVNAAWIIGRPVVYIICDVWSTAIVGFYVCLQGPSWNMAKLSLFSAGANPELIGALWGYNVVQSLFPAPTLPAVLLCDRGEYLSLAAFLTGIKLIPMLSYAAPYRPDLKGIVEVLHRIMKDNQRCDFIPGAIDARRKELELRKFNPNDGIFTIRQFVHYLQTIFTEYNLSANREARLDAHMKSAGVFPSPAGLWAWGHQMGIGVRRAVDQTDLISELLMADTCRVRRDGVVFGGRHYTSSEVEEQQWTGHARNFGGWDAPCFHYPGSVARIWTPHDRAGGLLDLHLSDQSTASHELTFDEAVDAFVYGNLSRADVAHLRAVQKLKSLRTVTELMESARAQTAAALSRNSGAKPSISEARKLEPIGRQTGMLPTGDSLPSPVLGEAEISYLEMMQALSAAQTEASPHG